MAAAVATALFGTAHASYYGSLGVSIRDVGLGPTEVLAQAAVGIVTAGVLYVISTASAAWLYVRGRGGGAEWEAAWTVGSLSVLYATAVGIVVAVVLALSNASWVVVAVAGLPLVALVGVPLLLGYDDRRKPPTIDRSLLRRRLGLVMGGAFAIVLVFLAAVTAVQDAGLVKKGVEPEGIIHALAGGPTPCVHVTWIGPTLPPNVPALAMHLGEAGGRVVLYVAGQGPVRLPASDIVITAAAKTACRSRQP